MSETLLGILLSGSGLTALVGAIITILNYRANKKSRFDKRIDEVLGRFDRIDDKISSIEERIDILENRIQELEVGQVREHLTTLIQHTPKNHDTINMVARKYFEELHGNWDMDEMYQKWCSENGYSLPSWFIKK